MKVQKLPCDQPRRCINPYDIAVPLVYVLFLVTIFWDRAGIRYRSVNQLVASNLSCLAFGRGWAGVYPSFMHSKWYGPTVRGKNEKQKKKKPPATHDTSASAPT